MRSLLISGMLAQLRGEDMDEAAEDRQPPDVNHDCRQLTGGDLPLGLCERDAGYTITLVRLTKAG